MSSCPDLAVDLVAGADREDLLHRALADEEVLAVSRETTTERRRREKVERYLVHLRIAAVDSEHLVQVDMRQHGIVEQVAQAGLEVAVQKGVLQDPLAFLAVDVEMALQDDAVLRQRAGLVGAQHVHRAEILDRIEALRDDLSARHGDRALGEVHRHDHRQHLGRETDGHRHREQQRLQPIVLGETIDQEHRRDHDHDEADHQPGEPVDAPIERGGNASPGDLVGKLSEERVLPGPQDHAGAVARHDVGAHEAQVRQVERGVAGLVARVWRTSPRAWPRRSGPTG